MSIIPEELIEQVRDAADLVHLIGEHVDLKRTGSDYRGPCPFHGGTKRNLSVIPKKQMFYCFVCHEGGDVFSFYMKHFGLEYPAAVREVAGKVGIVIPDRPTGGPDPREPLFQALAVAAEWYAARLRDAADAEAARRYLDQRGFLDERFHPLGLGFAPKGKAFLEAMDRLAISVEVLLEAGLAVRREDGSLRPRFWGRLLFPIHDLRGRVVGFGGRILGDGEPKYLNSPDSRIFHKGQLLYNLHHARPAIRKAQKALVVEGYFDALRAVDAGVEYVVAPLGTALTADQAVLLKRYAPEVVLLYDADTPGMKASFRAADELLRVGVRPMIATLPPGEDPDTLVVKGGASALTDLLADALDVFERKLQLLERKGYLGSLAGRRRSLDRLLPTLRAAKDPVTRDLYVGRAAETLGITAAAIQQEVDNLHRSGHVDRGRTRAAQQSTVVSGRARAESHLLRVMAHEPEWRARIVENWPERASLSDAERELFQYMAAQPDDLTGRGLLAGVEDGARSVLERLLVEPWGTINVDAVVDGAIAQIETRARKEDRAAVRRRMTVVPESEPEKEALLNQLATRSRR